jgi:hypothetical protein
LFSSLFGLALVNALHQRKCAKKFRLYMEKVAEGLVDEVGREK